VSCVRPEGGGRACSHMKVLSSVDRDGGAIRQDKYVVFKADDFRDPERPCEALEDCFVIRSSDLFGPATLYEYANLLQTSLEMDRVVGPFLSGDQRTQLELLAERVIEMAQSWQRAGKQRFPD
jgi:hypothetical protein